ncbi:MAG: hypothetical protein GY822_12825, partial [Deltaproteobacteria bacterium]|nr:hypothetical protein [Deltaproteobacteria bacterium]
VVVVEREHSLTRTRTSHARFGREREQLHLVVTCRGEAGLRHGCAALRLGRPVDKTGEPRKRSSASSPERYEKLKKMLEHRCSMKISDGKVSLL